MIEFIIFVTLIALFFIFMKTPVITKYFNPKTKIVFRYRKILKSINDKKETILFPISMLGTSKDEITLGYYEYITSICQEQKGEVSYKEIEKIKLELASLHRFDEEIQIWNINKIHSKILNNITLEPHERVAYNAFLDILKDKIEKTNLEVDTLITVVEGLG
jgi:hypothetical protein